MADAGAYSTYPTVTNKLMPPPDPMQAMGQAVGVANGIQALNQSQFDLAHKQLGAMNNIIGSIVALPKPTFDDVTRGVTQAVQMGVLPADAASRALSEMSTVGSNPDGSVNSDGLKRYLFGHLAQNMQVQERLRSGGMATPDLVDSGGKIQGYVRRDGLQPGVAPAQGAPIQKTMDPATAGAPTEGTPTAAGAPTVTSRGAMAEKLGTAAPGTYTAPGAQAGAPGSVVVGLPPGKAQAQTVTAQAGAEQGVKLQNMADGVPTRKAMFAQLENDLDQFKSGQGADWQMVAKNWANRNVLPSGLQFDPKSIASQEQFNKQAVMVAQQQFQALGGTGTNDQLGSAMKTSPNAALSEMGNRGIIQLLKGNEDAIDAKNQAWQKWKQQHGADTYDTFSTKFNQVYNPLVFQVQYMGPDEIANLQKKLSPKDAQKFAQSYAVAKAQGWIGGGNAGQ